MKTTLIVGLAIALVAMSLLPNAAAREDRQCFAPCDGPLGPYTDTVNRGVAAAKHLAEQIDPRDMPCTCDPGPNPGP